ncbi:MAG: hypothetical protein GQ574_16570 [Crocinitomix sp.]|nr:hypothetical protein [Crocinitomix sp.]
MVKLLLFIFISLLLFSCSKLENRINALEEELKITLPADYDVIEHEYYPQGLDYTFVLKLKFNSAGTDTLIAQIKTVPYFDQLDAFRTDGGSLTLMGDEVGSYKFFEDSIAKTPYRGSWTSTDVGYEFIGFRDNKSNIDAWINSTAHTLEFQYVSY